MKDLAVVGIGNMGISVLGAFLTKGLSCIAIDIDAVKVEELARGKSVVPEAGAEKIFQKALAEHRLEASTELARVQDAKAVFVGVQTPAEGEHCDYTVLVKVLSQLAECAPQGQALVVGSTVFPGGIEKHMLAPLAARPDLELIYEPVFLRAGFGIEDYQRPGKFIFGVKDPKNPPAVLNELFHRVVECPAKVVTWQDAEWIKMVHNAWLCLKVSFANELDVLCKSYNADSKTVFDICFNESKRGRLMTLAHMLPGPPYSGPCLPKDATILQGIFKERAEPWMGGGILEALKYSNDHFIESLIDRWIQAGKQSGKPLGLVGISFRPGFNEIRCSLILPFLRRALEENLPVMGYDPAFEGIGEEDYLLACRQNKELENYRECFSHSLEDVWKQCGVILLNRTFSPEELKLTQYIQPQPQIIDLYDNLLVRDNL
ncbi:MAG: nucleotide sugar dehydrogenase [Nitrospinaceae bacterium]